MKIEEKKALEIEVEALEERVAPGGVLGLLDAS